MTGYTVHTGSTEAYANNYDAIFGQHKTTKKKKAAGKSTKAAQGKTKAAAKKKRGKKS